MKSKPDQGLYWCSGCQQLHPKESFYISNIRSTGVSSRCKESGIAAAANWNKENAAQHRANLQAYRAKDKSKQVNKQWRLANKDKLREYLKQWRKENPGAWRVIEQRSRKNNIDRILTNNRKREIAKVCAIPPWANHKAISRIYAQAKTLTRETGVIHHVDHEIPLQRKIVCGLHVESNLQILVAEENLRKSNKFGAVAL